MSELDEAVNGSTIGYAKDSSDSYYYDETANRGLFNTMNGEATLNSVQNNGISNKGMRKRQETFRRVNASEYNQEALYGNNLDEIVAN